MNETTRHVRRNREHWETRSADYQDHNRSQLNTRWDVLGWGVWDIPEERVRALGDVDGLNALEFGCGACQSGIKVAAMGARVTGMDLSGGQLAEGVRNMRAQGIGFPIVQGDAERAPIADATFDLVWCDHGAMSFADPYRTVPEVARLLRPGGRLVFSIITPIAWVSMAPGDEYVSRELKIPYFGMHEADQDDPDWQTTEFQLTYGDWIRLFVSHGLVVEDLIELRPDEGATSTYVDPSELPWARDYPLDHIWKLRKS